MNVWKREIACIFVTDAACPAAEFVKCAVDAGAAVTGIAVTAAHATPSDRMVMPLILI